MSSKQYLSIIGVMLLASGCQRVKDAVSTTPQMGIVALIDISVSTDQASLRQRYHKELVEIVEKVVPYGAMIRADAIRATPLAETTFPIRIDVPRMSVIDKNEFLLEDAVKKAKCVFSSIAITILF